MQHSRIGALAAAAVAGLAATLVVAGPAAAAEPTRFDATSPSDTTATKEATVRCPGSAMVFGVGGRVNDGHGDVTLTGIVPDPTLTSVHVSAQARPGHLGDWSVTAFAVCAPTDDRTPYRVAVAGPGGAATAACHDGDRLFGNGFAIARPGDGGLLDALVPDADLTAVSAHVRGAATLVVAFAVCAAPTYSSERCAHMSATDPSSPKVVGTACPDQIGYARVPSVGGVVLGGGDVHLDALVPGSGLGGDGWVRAQTMPPAAPLARSSTGRGPRVAGADGGGGDDWSVTAFGNQIGSWY